MYDETIKFRSLTQQKTTRTMQMITNDLIVQLSIAREKSLLMKLSRFLNRDHITLIVMSYVSLRENLRKRSTQRELKCITLINDAYAKATMMFTTSKQLISENSSS